MENFLCWIDSGDVHRTGKRKSNNRMERLESVNKETLHWLIETKEEIDYLIIILLINYVKNYLNINIVVNLDAKRGNPMYGIPSTFPMATSQKVGGWGGGIEPIGSIEFFAYDLNKWIQLIHVRMNES